MRCTMCGHDSPAGSLFCLNCGSQLGAGYPPQTSGQGSGLSGGQCPTCRTENPPGMKFCRNCGTVLGTGGPASRPGSNAPTTPQGQEYGTPVPHPYSPPQMAPSGGAQAPYAPPPSMPPPGPLGGGAVATPSKAGTVICPRCGAQTPSGFAFCQQCGVQLPAIDPQGPTMAGGADLVRGVGALGTAQPVPSRPQLVPSPSTSPSAGAWGYAISVNRDGSDGERFPLAAEYVNIGRAGADVAFDQDRFLARVHARVEKSGDSARVVPVDTLNGVFRKLDGPVELVDNAIILVGREVLRYETLDGDERASEPLVRHGVALFGSPPRDPWGRLIQLLPSGGTRDIRHLFGDEIVLGREEGDVVFRDDAFMSRRHAAITWDGRRPTLTDLGSSNGTFIRLTGPAAIRNGDQLRMGDQLFRFELQRR